ncbi:hypothetical protein ACTSKR_04800 [Chitinibacteraceae bacterium HSL-7]
MVNELSLVVRQAVFRKTVQGVAELSDRTLSVALRRVLIPVDGQRTVGSLAGLAGNEVVEALAVLLHQGFIECDDQAARAIVHASLPVAVLQSRVIAPEPEAVMAADLSDQHLDAVKQKMVSSCEVYLGLLGKSLAREIGGIHSLAALRGVLGRWQLAMRELHGANEAALQVVDDVKAMMRGASFSVL